MKLFSCSLISAGLLVLAASSQAQVKYFTHYVFNMNDGNNAGISNIMLLEDGPGFGSSTWAFSAQGVGSTNLDNPFSFSTPPTTTLILGLVHDLPNDPAGQYHVVIGMDNTAAATGENIAWGTLFRNTNEDQLIAAIQLATSGQAWNVIQPGLDAVGTFANGDAMTGILNPSTAQPVSAWFATGGAFTVETWSQGTIIGTGTSSIQSVPEPCSMVALSLGGLALLRRRRA